MTDTVVSLDTKAVEAAAGLRELADFIEANPDLPWGYSLDRANLRIGVSASIADDPAADLAAFARSGGRWVKTETNDNWFVLTRSFGIAEIEVFAERAQVCDRVVVGTRTVEKVIPTAHRTETVEEEIVEWQCRPLLAGEVQ